MSKLRMGLHQREKQDGWLMAPGTSMAMAMTSDGDGDGDGCGGNDGGSGVGRLVL